MNKRLIISLILLILLLTNSISYSWQYYGNDLLKTYSSNLIGFNTISERYSNTITNFSDKEILAKENNLFLLSKNSFFILNNELNIQMIKNNINDFIIDNNSILLAGSKLLIDDFSGNNIDEINISFNKLLVINNDIIYGIEKTNLIGLNKSNKTILFNNSINCNNKINSVFFNENIIFSCDKKLFSFDLLGNELFNLTFNEEIQKINIFENKIIVSLSKSIDIINTIGEKLDELYFVSLSNITSNIAIKQNELFICSENGLYSVKFNNEINKLFYSKSPLTQYSNCHSIIIFDYNNDHNNDILFQDENNNLIIIEKNESELIKKPLNDYYFFSIDNVNNENYAQILTISKTGVGRIFDTINPDDKINLTITNNSFLVTAQNIGLKESIGEIVFKTPFETIITNISLNPNEIKNYYFYPTIYNNSNYEINVTINDINDINMNNNFDNLFINVLNITKKNDFENNETLFIFNNNYSAKILNKDINNDGTKEKIFSIKDNIYSIYEKNNLFYDIGDIKISSYNNSISKKRFENESILLKANISNLANYNYYNVKIFYILNDEYIYFKTLNLTQNHSYLINYSFSNLSIGTNRLGIYIDYNNLLLEKDKINNYFDINYLINRIDKHDLTFLIKKKSIDLHNQFIILKLNNSGEFNETLNCFSSPSFFKEKKITINKKTVSEFIIEFNKSIGEYSFELFLNNSKFNFSKNVNFTLNCKFDNDCKNGKCIDSTCLYNTQEYNSSTEYLINNDSKTTENLTYIIQKKTLSGMIISNKEKSNLGVYFINLFLIGISSYLIYLISKKLLFNYSKIISFINFIIFLIISILFVSNNMSLILFEDIILKMILLIIIKKR